MEENKREKGYMVWGQKSLLSRPSSLDRLDIRLYLVCLEKCLNGAMEDYDVSKVSFKDTENYLDKVVEGFQSIPTNYSYLDWKTNVNVGANSDYDIYISSKDKFGDILQFRVQVTQNTILNGSTCTKCQGIVDYEKNLVSGMDRCYCG